MRKEKKDILFLLQFFYPEYISSATLPYDTAKAFVEAGYSVDVMCGYPKEYSDANVESKEIHQGIGIRRVNYLQLNRKKVLGRLINYFSFTLAIFVRLFSMRNYKTIIVYSNPPLLPWVAAIASKVFGAKLVFVAYDLYPEIAIRTGVMAENGPMAKVMRHINNVVYRQADAVVALSSEMKVFISENRPIPENRIIVIPNWFEDSYVENNRQKPNRFDDLVRDRSVISYFGNMGIAQDMKTIVDVIIELKNETEICFLLAGHGNKFQYVKETLEINNVKNAYVYEFLHGEDYLDALRISDCAIVSLEKGLTGLCVPSKIYGYMMQGLPIIALVDESDIVRDIQKGAGYYVPDNSVNELIDIIGEIKSNPQECQNKGSISRQLYLDKYTPKICLRMYTELIKTFFEEKQ